ALYPLLRAAAVAMIVPPRVGVGGEAGTIHGERLLDGLERTRRLLDERLEQRPQGGFLDIAEERVVAWSGFDKALLLAVADVRVSAPPAPRRVDLHGRAVHGVREPDRRPPPALVRRLHDPVA